MATDRNNWLTLTEPMDDPPDRGPIPFPTRRARMTLRPRHLETVEAENADASEHADAAYEAVELVSRRMDTLARQLNCLWFYDDQPVGDDDDPPPSAA